MLADDFHNQPQAASQSMTIVAGRPFLEWQLLVLKAQGFNDIVLCVNEGADELATHFGDGSKLDLDIDYAIADDESGTASAVLAASDLVDGTFLLLHATTFFDVDYQGLIDFHEGKEAALSMTLAIAGGSSDTASRYGSVSLDINHRITRFIEGSDSAESFDFGYANGGAYAVEPAVLGEIAPNSHASFEDVAAGLIDNRSVFGYISDGYPIDITTNEGLTIAQKYFAPHA
jgi:NDP-sugar pyrophosphorylase family protein